MAQLRELLKNRHMTIAMMVAPVLAIISYFATDYFVSTPPASASAGQSYLLIAKPNCRYQSGECTLINGDLEIDLRLEQAADGSGVLLARSNYPIAGARVALANTGKEAEPRALEARDSSGENWQLPVSRAESRAQELRVAMLANESIFYARTETDFFEYDTVFPRDSW